MDLITVGSEAIKALDENEYDQAVGLLLGYGLNIKVVKDADKDLMDRYAKIAMDIHWFRISDRFVTTDIINDYLQELLDIEKLRKELITSFVELLKWFYSITDLLAPKRIGRSLKNPRSRTPKDICSDIELEVKKIDNSDFSSIDLAYISKMIGEQSNYIHSFKVFSGSSDFFERVKRGKYCKYIMLLMDNSKYTRVLENIEEFSGFTMDTDKRILIEEKITNQKRFLDAMTKEVNLAISTTQPSKQS